MTQEDSSAAPILVTGATGFLGGHLVARLLDDDHRVRILCRSEPKKTIFDQDRVEIVRGELTDAPSLEAAVAGCRQVYHVAGRVDFQPKDDRLLRAVNIDGTRNLLTACREAGVERVVHVSSVSTIGAARDPDHPLSEKDFGQGLGTDLPYPRSKLAGERVALEFAEQGLPVVIANPTFIIGPNDPGYSSARTVISFVQRQTWIGLNRGGMGATDVRDVAAGLVLAMERGRPGERYIIGGHNVRLPEYHATLGRLTGLRPPRIRVHPHVAIPLARVGQLGYRLIGRRPFVGPGDVRLGRHWWFYDYRKAQQELGLECRSVEDSLRDTLTWLAEEGLYRPRLPSGVPA